MLLAPARCGRGRGVGGARRALLAEVREMPSLGWMREAGEGVLETFGGESSRPQGPIVERRRVSKSTATPGIRSTLFPKSKRGVRIRRTSHRQQDLRMSYFDLSGIRQTVSDISISRRTKASSANLGPTRRL